MTTYHELAKQDLSRIGRVYLHDTDTLQQACEELGLSFPTLKNYLEGKPVKFEVTDKIVGFFRPRLQELVADLVKQ